MSLGETGESLFEALAHSVHLLLRRLEVRAHLE